MPATIAAIWAGTAWSTLLVLDWKTWSLLILGYCFVASLSPMRARRLDAPMVGRARESALLAGAFERAASDRACQLFTVLGAAGAARRLI